MAIYTQQHLLALAEREGRLDFQELMQKRAKDGFTCKIQDLKNDSFEGKGWTLKQGLLNVKEQHDTKELMDYLENKLSSYDWFQTRRYKMEQEQQGKVFEKPQLPYGYDGYAKLFKVLGYWGENPAMDVICLLKTKEGKIAVQVTVRFDKTFAFVGGMIDKGTSEQKDVVLKKCVQEFLEEFYSNDLFVAGSETHKLASAMNPQDLAAALQRAVPPKDPNIPNEFDKLEPMKAELYKVFAQNPGLDFHTKITTLEAKLRQLGEAQKIGAAELDVFWVRIKCCLYQECFPRQFNSMKEFLNNNLVPLPKTINEGDPRNTDTAYMVTYPHYLSIDKHALEQYQKDWGVKPKGGDDVIDAKVKQLEDLYKVPMFSSHGKFLLQAIAHKTQGDPAYISDPVVQEQIAAVEAKIAERELKILGAVQANNGVLVQNDQSFATASGPAQLEQVNNNLPADVRDDTPKSLSYNAQDANQILKSKLGLARYNRMAAILETSGLSASARVVLAKLVNFDKVHIVIDNSGSMDGLDYETIDPETNRTIKITRWQEAKRRVDKLLPLLALAGVKVEFSFLNNPKVVEHKTHAFDFSSKPGQNDVPSLETELYNAQQFLKKVFDARPDGGTEVAPRLKGPTSQGTETKPVFTMLITDGQADDEKEAVAVLNARKNNAANPVTVIGCTNHSEHIGWVRDLAKQPSTCVAMLDDFGKEKSRLAMLQGTMIPFNRAIYEFLHITPRSVGEEAEHGFMVYHYALSQDKPLSQEQLAELLGYSEMTDIEYDMYLDNRVKYQAALRGNPGAQMSGQMAAFGAPAVGNPPPFASAPYVGVGGYPYSNSNNGASSSSSNSNNQQNNRNNQLYNRNNI